MDNVWVNDSSGSRASSLWSQHVPKPLYKSFLLKMQAFTATQDKNTFSYVCNLGLKVSRADSGRNGKFIKIKKKKNSSFCSLMHSGQLKHLMNAP